MNKAVLFRWARRASRPDAQVVLVQDGKSLPPASLPAADRQALDAWLKATKFKGKAAATAWVSMVTSPC